MEKKIIKVESELANASTGFNNISKDYGKIMGILKTRDKTIKNLKSQGKDSAEELMAYKAKEEFNALKSKLIEVEKELAEASTAFYKIKEDHSKNLGILRMRDKTIKNLKSQGKDSTEELMQAYKAKEEIKALKA